jgi:peptidoglycan hydrolase CwlO-like protein
VNFHKNVFATLSIALLFAGCNGAKIEELEKQKLQLAAEKEAMQRDAQERERRIVESFTTLTEINEDLAKVDSAIVALQPQEKGAAGRAAAVTEATKQHIENIRAQLEDKLKKIEELTEKNKKAGVRIASLNNKIKALLENLAQKQADIDALVAKVDGLNQMVSAQGVTIETQKQNLGKADQQIREHKERLAKMQEEMERVWYVAGNKDRLLADQVVRSEGGFLFGWGAVLVLNSPALDDKFTPSSSLASEISVPGEIESLIPARAAESYKVETNAQGARVVILKPDAFWQDRHLAILTK